jgi:hypothetical protein
LVRNLGAIVVVVCGGAGGWYDYRRQALLSHGALWVYATRASRRESAVAATGVAAAPELTATTPKLQAYIGVIMLAGSVVCNAIPPPPW